MPIEEHKKWLQSLSDEDLDIECINNNPKSFPGPHRELSRRRNARARVAEETAIEALRTASEALRVARQEKIIAIIAAIAAIIAAIAAMVPIWLPPK
jgi:hypothetical protein